jgi:YfiH family protein
MKPAAAEDLLTWMVLGVIIGGRLGFVLFYQPAYYLANPAEILAVWRGGMSFHGGFLGVVVALIAFGWRNGVSPVRVGDAVAAAAPIGIFFGRLANFINAELWGRPTDVPWAVAFPGAGATCPPDWTGVCARHPSQLYEAGLEGLLLGLVILWAILRLRVAGPSRADHRAVPRGLRRGADVRRALPRGRRAVRHAGQPPRARAPIRRDRPEHGPAPVAADAARGPRADALEPASGMTPLERLIRERIAAAGPLGVADYMALCLGHPEHGYYATRDPFGAAGDFVTAPELGQLFGEMIGAWLAQVWHDLGRPDPFVLAELGPGRGTLMADLLRVTDRLAGFAAAARVLLVETSPALRARQAAVLAGRSVGWAERVEALPEGPLLLVANEFFDALPVRQFRRADPGWQERQVVEEGGALRFDWGPLRLDPAVERRFPLTPDGTVVEVCEAGEAIAATLGRTDRTMGRCGADRRLRRMGRDRRHAAGGGRACAGGPARRAGRGRPDGACALQGAGGGLGAASARAGRAGRLSRTARDRPAGGAARRGAGRRRARAPRRANSALDPSGRDGTAIQGHGADATECSAATGIRRMSLEVLTSDLLEGTRHGFFTRRGGASSGVYSGLNCGPGSSDQAEAVGINRARVAEAMGIPRERLLSLYQVHSAEVVVAGPEGWRERPRADAAVTDRPGIALSVLTADCAPVLFHDPEAGVIGAAHAGWRGALDGVVEATLEAMERLGAETGRVRAAVGPTISQRAYEVGPEFFEAFMAEDPAHGRSSSAAARTGSSSTCRVSCSGGCGAPAWATRAGSGNAPIRCRSATSPIAARPRRARATMAG